ncbi:MAG: response regulator [Lentisphaeria bacterium]|nr:response regulator [Lentisphaeria bacterium]
MSSEAASILFISDQPNSAYSLKDVLENNSYGVNCCDSILRGLRFLNMEKPDLAIVDLGLEGGKGLNLCHAIRSDYRDVPLIAIYPDADGTICAQAFEAGVEDFIEYPFKRPALLARISRLVSKSISGSLGASLSVQITSNELPGILQLLETEEKTGRLEVLSGELNAEVYLIQGTMIRARCGELISNDAIAELMCWQILEVTFHEEDVAEDLIEMQLKVASVIMNCAVEVDEFREIRSHLPKDDLVYLPTEKTPDATQEEGLRNIYDAALMGYETSVLVTRIYPSERKSTIWLNTLLEEGYLTTSTNKYLHYIDYAKDFYGKQDYDALFEQIKDYFGRVTQEVDWSQGKSLSKENTDWLTSRKRLIVLGDNDEHTQVFIDSMIRIYITLNRVKPADRQVAKNVHLYRFNLNGESFDLVHLTKIKGDDVYQDLEMALEGAFGVIHFASSQDHETNSHVRRIQRVMHRYFTGVFYHVVPRVPDKNGQYMFKFNCFHCDFKLSVSQDDAGIAGECPVCSNALSIPHALDNLAYALELPEVVPVVTIEPMLEVHCRDLVLMTLDSIKNIVDGDKMHIGQMTVKGLVRKKSRQLEIAETRRIELTKEEKDQLQEASEEQPRSAPTLKLKKAAPVQEEADVDDILEMLSEETRKIDKANLASGHQTSDDINDLLNEIGS